jgi:hypothetical protein
MLIEISPAVSSWKNGSGSFTVYTGSEPHLNAWAKLGVAIVDVPAHSNSPGTIGQIAYDSTYMYRCTQTNVTEVSDSYTTTMGDTGNPSYNSGWNNQTFGANLHVRLDGYYPMVLIVEQSQMWILPEGYLGDISLLLAVHLLIGQH